MSDPIPTPPTPLPPIPVPIMPVATRTISEDTIFAALFEPARRRMLIAMFDGQFHPGHSLATGSGRKFDTARKHLDVLVKAGLAESKFDPKDKRRQLYKLAPWIRAETTPQGRRLDLGCCILRV